MWKKSCTSFDKTNFSFIPNVSVLRQDFHGAGTTINTMQHNESAHKK